MWSLTKKIVGAALLATVLGVAVGYATGLLLPGSAALLAAYSPFTFAGATTFAPDTVALFFGLSGGLMGAVTKSIELATAASPTASEHTSDHLRDPLIASAAPARSQETDQTMATSKPIIKSDAPQSVASTPGPQIHSAHMAGLLASAEQPRTIH